ncbi:replication-associated protein [Fly associated circular virus 4]|uniref:Replication-associated protein n=1 Tax=Fly associated circular virus 4 TaxID=2293284 RepID=A0A346BPB4_9VIRU|nr:replication-associated protein [Fly associated circular virus 4]AXL65911.1 replication-associated protein [Fly associated circular virus 4]
MVKVYLLTVPLVHRIQFDSPLYRWRHSSSYSTKRAIRILIESLDCKRWIVARERGRGGYEHLQVRVETSADNFFDRVSRVLPCAHIEESTSAYSDWYERKEGRYVTSSDLLPGRTKVLKQRFGCFYPFQKRVLRALQSTNDREVVVWYDQTGNAGKSWLKGALWERGLAYIIQPMSSISVMVQDVADEYLRHGYRQYLVIDIPRTWKWSEDLYCAIETIKDGLLKDPRYNSETVNIAGVQVLILCNTLPKLDKLSVDRWIILNRDGTRRGSFS